MSVSSINNTHYEEDFASYLHNPYGFPSDIEKKSIERITNVIPNIHEYLFLILTNFFGDTHVNTSNGLVFQYTILKEYIIKHKLIGLIYWGADSSKDTFDTVVSKYTPLNKSNIELTTGSICNYLLKEFIKQENVEQLCINSLL